MRLYFNLMSIEINMRRLYNSSLPNSPFPGFISGRDV